LAEVKTIEESSAVAREYALALLGLAGANADAVGAELDALVDLTLQVPEMNVLLANPAFSPTEKIAVLRKAIGGSVSELVEDFLCVLVRNGRGGFLAGVAKAYRDLANARAGRVELAVTTAVALDDAQQAQLSAALADLLQAQPVMKLKVDPDVLGGIRVVVGDKVIDGTIRAQLDDLRRRLKR
jgi:F-type H+-transporting ATPase subunit delta